MNDTMPGHRSQEDAIRNLISDHGQANLDQSALLGLAHRIQEHFGFIPMAAVELLASALNLSRADVYGFVTFYQDFEIDPEQAPAHFNIEICNAEACQALGSRALLADAKAYVEGLGPGEKAGVKEIFCLGCCSTGPNLRVGQDIIGRCNSQKVRQILKGGRAHLVDEAQP